MQNSTPETVVYAIRAVNTCYIKIGTTTNLACRLTSLQTASPFLLEIVATWPGGKWLESVLHRELAQFRITGEWFNVDEQVIHEAVNRFHSLAIDNMPQKLARLVSIHSEIALTRHPVHRLAKKGTIKIEQIEENANGELVAVWEVLHPPGPLAYKVDTLVVNRRIDEMRQRGEIHRLIKLGSLREICQELGILGTGPNIKAVRDALYDNAKAFIKAQLEFTENDGAKGFFGFAGTRYNLYFAGQELPNGRTADAVYVSLHEDYRTLLNRAQTRPLDYEYLKELAPAPHRLYELLSFAMFGALKYGRPTAHMRYSEFCRDAPLTRHYDSRKMHTQMWKIHQPHIKHGYCERVEFEETLDAEGQIDWVLKYTPGPRARREHALFTKKQFAQQEQAVPRLVPAPQAAPKPAAPPPLNAEEQALVEQLTAYKITASKARKLVVEQRAAVERELQAFPQRDKSSIKSPAAWLIRAIEQGDYSAPSQPAARAKPQPPTPQQQQQEAQARAAAQCEQEARDRHFAAELAARKRYEQLSPAELQQRQAQAEAACGAAQVADYSSQGIWGIVLKSLVVKQLTAALAAGDGQPPTAHN